MRQAQVFYQDKLAGLLTENEEGYYFIYDNPLCILKNTYF